MTGIVVVHWRGMEVLLDCLRSLAPVAAAGAPIVIAVNGSPDFDETAAATACPGVRTVRADANRGYAAGCNLGWRALGASPAAPAAVLFLNNDVIVPPTLLGPIDDCFARNPRVGIAGATVVYDADPTRVWAAGGRINRTFGYTRHIGFNTPLAAARPALVDYVNGSAIAVRLNLLRDLGGWDESFFHFFDEVDLCERARHAGWSSMTVPGAAIRHKVSATTGHAGSARFNRAQAWYFARNRVRFVRRHLHGWRMPVALAAQLPLVAYESVRAIAARNPAEARGRCEGLIAGYAGRSGERRGGW